MSAIKKPIAYWQKTLISLCLIIIIAPSIYNLLHKQEVPQKIYGKPLVITKPLSFDNVPITQIVDDGKNMYVMADCHRGYIQVYDLNGKYQHTLSFYDSTINGSFDMAIDSNMLYVRDSECNIYVFDNGKFKEFLNKTNATKISAGKSFGEFSARYKIRWGSVWRVDVKDPVCVIRRSANAAIHQYYLDWLVVVGCMLTIAFCSIRLKGSQNGH